MKPIQSNHIDFGTLKSTDMILGRAGAVQQKLASIANPYIGNKRKLFVKIIEILDIHKVPYSSVLDLFAGSCSVSLGFKRLGSSVFCNDIMNWCWGIGLSLVENNSLFPSEKQRQFLLENEVDQSYPMFKILETKYGDRFTSNEINRIANYRANVDNIINQMPHGSVEGTYMNALLLTGMLFYILERCFVGGRLNNGQVLAKVNHRIAHARNGGQEMKFTKITYPDFRMKNGPLCHATRLDAINLLTMNHPKLGERDLVYIDPPYGGDQSDYGKMYEFCEDYWICGDYSMMSKSQKFIKTKGYAEHFEDILICLDNFPNLLFSYNDSSWADIDKIKEIIGGYRKDVVVESVNYKYNYRDQEEDTGATEYLIVAR